MKRLIITALAALTLVGPLTVTASAQPGQGRDDRREWRDDRRDDRRDYRDDRRDDRREYRDDRRDDRRSDGRWDGRRHNGYRYQGRWHYGAPPVAYYGRPGFEPGYQAWRRGDRLPPGYRYQVVDYRRYNYAPPPRGYHYVRDDRGDVILAAIATGIIASIILSN